MNKKTLEGLYKKGLINEDTYCKGMKKFADGGAVLDPAIASLIQPQTVAAAPQSTSPTVAPEIQDAALKAQQNTVEQAQKLPEIERAPAATPAEKNYYAYNRIVAELGPEAAKEAVAKGQVEQPPGFFQSKILEPLMKFREENIAAKEAKKAQILKEAGIAPKPEVAPQAQVAPGMQQVAAQPKAKQVSPFEEIGKEYDRGYKALEKAYDAQVLAADKTASAMAGAYNTVMNDFKKQQDLDKIANEKNKERLDLMAKKYEGMVDDYAKTSVVDPNRYWANKSDGDRAQARLAVFLGGIGGGGPNEVLAQFNKNVDRDIEAQKAGMEKKFTGMQLQNNIYKQMMDLTQDDRAARLATRNAMMGMFEMQIKKAEAGTASQNAKLKAQQLLGELSIEKAKTQTELLKAVQNSPMNLQADVETRQINTLPSNLQSKAYEELGKYRQTMSDVNMVKDTLKKISDISLAGRMNAFDRDQIETYKTSLIKPIKSMLGEAMQEADVKRLVDPLIPSGLSSKKDAERKTDVFVQNLMSTIPEKTPILTGNGIIKASFLTNLKRND